MLENKKYIHINIVFIFCFINGRITFGTPLRNNRNWYDYDFKTICIRFYYYDREHYTSLEKKKKKV